MSFDPNQWGTVAEWTGALLSGLSIFAALVYYIFDRQRERRTQASSVMVWLHPHEHGPPYIKIKNLSGKPVFDHGCVVTSKPKRQLEDLAQKGWTNSGPFKWPEGNEFSFQQRTGSPINYHDGSELYLADQDQVELLPTLAYAPAAYDYYAYFRDATGQYWVVNARTQKLSRAWRYRKFGITRVGLEAT